MDNSWSGAAVHELASPLYKGSKEMDNSWSGAAVHELASHSAVSVFRTAPSAMHFDGRPIYINTISTMGRIQSSCNYGAKTIHSPMYS